MVRNVNYSSRVPEGPSRTCLTLMANYNFNPWLMCFHVTKKLVNRKFMLQTKDSGSKHQIKSAESAIFEKAEFEML